MRGKCLLAILVFVLAATPCIAGTPNRTCDPSGTWLGGSDPFPDYQLTIAPLSDGLYSVMYQMVFPAPAGNTSYTGQMRKTGARTFSQTAVATIVLNEGAAQYYLENFGLVLTTDDITKPELDAVSLDVTMLDCDTLHAKVTWFGWYIPFTFEKVPFVTEPEVEFISLIGTPIDETYHRVATTCAACKEGKVSPGLRVQSGTPSRRRKR